MVPAGTPYSVLRTRLLTIRVVPEGDRRAYVSWGRRDYVYFTGRASFTIFTVLHSSYGQSLGERGKEGKRERLHNMCVLWILSWMMDGVGGSKVDGFWFCCSIFRARLRCKDCTVEPMNEIEELRYKGDLLI